MCFLDCGKLNSFLDDVDKLDVADVEACFFGRPSKLFKKLCCLSQVAKFNFQTHFQL